MSDTADEPEIPQKPIEQPALPADWRKFHSDNVAKLDPDLRRKAVQFLTTRLYRDSYVGVIQADPQGWWAASHFQQGMQLRNLLRQNGFGEKEFQIDNLDDYYVGLVELAVMGDGYFATVEKRD